MIERSVSEKLGVPTEFLCDANHLAKKAEALGIPNPLEAPDACLIELPSVAPLDKHEHPLSDEPPEIFLRHVQEPGRAFKRDRRELAHGAIPMLLRPRSRR